MGVEFVWRAGVVSADKEVEHEKKIKLRIIVLNNTKLGLILKFVSRTHHLILVFDLNIDLQGNIPVRCCVADQPCHFRCAADYWINDQQVVSMQHRRYTLFGKEHVIASRSS